MPPRTRSSPDARSGASPTSWPGITASDRCSARIRSSSGTCRSTARTRMSTPAPTSTGSRRVRPKPRLRTPRPVVPTYREAMTTATAAELEAVWAERVRQNRDQVDLIREVPDRDFYAPVSSLFVADPRRTGEDALEALLRLTAPNDRWLDIGAGAAR